ncbi:MAG: hypothetical protein M1817_005784 [Caeruleum heppii]|nr:MAG: hypothetical protein M1817_005784 [Caeruleum heppii]
MATSIPANPTAQTVAILLPKLSDADSDFRFMSLNDLYTVLSTGHQGLLLQDYNTAARAVDGILKTLDDQNGEVQNLAIKCLAPLALRIPPSILPPLVEKLSNLTTEHAVDSSIPAMALRTVITTFPRPVPGVRSSKATEEAYSAISRVLIPRLVGYIVLPQTLKNLPDPPKGMLEVDNEKGPDADTVDVLIEVVRCFGPMLEDAEIRALQRSLTNLLEAERVGSVVKKRAVTAMSVLAVYFPDDLLSAFVSQSIETFRNPHLTPAKRRLFINIIGSMARSIPQRFGPYLKTMAPFILSALSHDELVAHFEKASEIGELEPLIDEVREAALVALEGFLASCSNEMRSYTQDVIAAALRFLRYDPNFSDDPDDEMNGSPGAGDTELDGLDGIDEDFEEEGGFSDDDDASWKVRRCAAKVLYTLISTRASGDLLDDGTLYGQVAPVLIERFQEREENVRLEVLATMGSLVRKTGEGAPTPISTTGTTHGSTPAMPQSRKRRRGGSDVSTFDPLAMSSMACGSPSPVASPTPSSAARASLHHLRPTIMRSLTPLLRGTSLPSKQAAMSLLRDIVSVQRGGLWEYLNQIVDPTVDAIKTSGVAHAIPVSAGSGGGAASTTGGTLGTEALTLVALVVETHPTQNLQPLFEKWIPPVVRAAKDKLYKVSIAALEAIEQLVKSLTPPRSMQNGQQQQAYLEQLYEVIMDRVSASDADAEVRQRAILALGLLVGRTAGPAGSKMFSKIKRTKAASAVLDRLRNETTRLASIHAIETVGRLSRQKGDLDADWVRHVVVELGAQLRKANRSLRSGSLSALRTLVVSPAGHENLDERSIEELMNVLSPLLTADDHHLLGPALVVLSILARTDAKVVMRESVVKSLCSLVQTSLSGVALEALLMLVKSIAEQGAGQSLMQGLLKDVGVDGDPAIVGKVIGSLLVYGGSSVGVSVDDFRKELESAPDDQRKCLALYVLGETGLRSGSSSTVKPDLFTVHFDSKSDQVPLAAAVALGRAGASNISQYLPVILDAMSSRGNAQYLLLHSLKEILQDIQDIRERETSLAPYSDRIWTSLLRFSLPEDNKAVGAECMGRMTIFAPKKYLPNLQTLLDDDKASIRGLAIQALRYTLVEQDPVYDEVLKPLLVSMLTMMLRDVDLENRRLAMTTLNSATHNKPELLLAHLNQILPIVMEESKLRPVLVREVQMGPFRHKVDDGLEVRKSAYETLYALMETAFSRMNNVEFFDRVVAGLEDEHDIRVLCNLMLTKLIVLDPEETVRRLDAIAERFRAILSFKLKDNAVKQEIEKAEEASKGVLRVSVELNHTFPSAGGMATSGQNQVWRGYWEWARKDFGGQIKGIEEEGMGRSG